MIAERRLARRDSLLSRRTAGRIIAFLFAILAGVGNLAGVVLPMYPAASRPLIALVCVALIAIGLVLWYLPWERWPRHALLWTVPLAFVAVDVFNIVIPINPYRYGLYLIALFAWIGIVHRRGTSLAFLPLLLAAYLLPLKVTGLLTPASGLGIVYVALFCVLQGETLAWIMDRLTKTDWALQVSQERYRALSENATDLVAIAGQDGRYTYASPSFQTVLGYAPAKVAGTPIWNHFDARSRALVKQHWAAWQEPGAGPTRLEVCVRHAGGSWRWFELMVQPVLDDPAIGGIMAIARDITDRKKAEEKLRQSQEQYRQIVETTQEGILLLGADAHITYVNQRMAAMLGYTVEEMLGQPLFAFMDEEEAAAARPEVEQRRHRLTETRQFDSRFLHKDGTAVWVLASTVALTDEAGQFAGEFGMLTDITERKRAEDAVRRSEEWFRALSENATDLVEVLDDKGVIRYASPSHLTVMGYDPADLTGRAIWNFLHPDDRATLQAEWTQGLVDTAQSIRGEYRLRHADGSWRWLESVSRVALHDPAIGGIICNARDVTERKQMEEDLRYQALHDALTGLPNRTLLQERLAQSLTEAQRGGGSGGRLALLLLGLDRFNEVNDTFGHSHGDLVLQEVARRLGAASRPADLVARLGGDEFAVVGMYDDAAALAAADTLCHALADPFEVEGYVLHLAASIGMALFPAHGTDAASLLRCADVAMYAAKQDGRTVAVYAPERDPYSAERIALLSELRQAIARGGLVLHYQPKVALATGDVCGVEALVRWPHPVRGMIGPDRFISLAEQSGQIGALTRWVLEEAIRQARLWQSQGIAVPIAVNLSTANLLDLQLQSVVAGLLATYDVPPSLLRLEVTESTLMADTERALDVLTSLSTLGLGLSIDDYGTGYSSLAYIKQLAVDEIKIDRSFVQHMAEDESDAMIVASTVGLAHSLGRRVVAEGVETEHALRLLHDMQCDVVQGYYLSRPLPPEGFERWVHERSAMAAGHTSTTSAA